MSPITSLVRRWIPRGVRNWLRSPARSLVWVRDEFQHAVGLDRTIELRPGWRLRCHPAACRAFKRSQQYDQAQAAELDGFITVCTSNMLLLDVGAHFGVFSLAALRYGGPAARAVAVEPSAMAMRILRIQRRLNRAEEQLTLIHAMACEHPGEGEMLPVGVIADGYYIRPEGDRPRSDLVRVRRVTVDGLSDTLGVDPSHIKIDVEGAELPVLRGARRTLTRAPGPVLFLELHNDICRSAGADPSEPVRMLASLGYRLCALDGAELSDEAATGPAVVRAVGRKSHA